ncbi:pyridoxal-phosphate dependent enzyme [Saccharopolyspora spinosporotrichia]
MLRLPGRGRAVSAGRRPRPERGRRPGAVGGVVAPQAGAVVAPRAAAGRRGKGGHPRRGRDAAARTGRGRAAQGRAPQPDRQLQGPLLHHRRVVGQEAGASTVAVASSGNAGVAAAAYAAAAGLESVVVTTGEISGTSSGLVRRFGGRLLFGDTPEQRWAILREHADEWTVLTNTSEVPVSSLWVGIEGYKTIAYEIVRDLGDVPEVVLAPVSRGDGFAGMWLGFQELRELGVVSRTPRMVAVERYPSLSRALREGAEPPPAGDVAGPVEATSISNPQATVMSLRVIRESGGTAVACTDADLHEAAERLGRAGVGVELSSAAGLVGIDALRRDSLLEPGDRAVALVTSHAANQPGTLR